MSMPHVTRSSISWSNIKHYFMDIWRLLHNVGSHWQSSEHSTRFLAHVHLNFSGLSIPYQVIESMGTCSFLLQQVPSHFNFFFVDIIRVISSCMFLVRFSYIGMNLSFLLFWLFSYTYPTFVYSIGFQSFILWTVIFKPSREAGIIAFYSSSAVFKSIVNSYP